jgi:Na+-driven multidrug efflux pump
MSSFEKKSFFAFCIVLLLCFVFVDTSFAQTPPNLGSQITGQLNAGTDVAGLGKADPREVIAGVIKALLTLVGIIFTTLIIYSGYTILTSGGDESKVEKAKKTITAAVIGLTITLGAYSLTYFLGKAAVQITNEAPTEVQNDDLHWRDLRDDVDDGLFGDTGNNVE